eukprot:gb/GECH01012215.1/.p1 GENE.gb/GECH01012215.1/~~gb/GECH01012215.1/.p1  ORF type:complete len:317 (+),score=78.65 gb/GECH01012215.1/:1-951(+)
MSFGKAGKENIRFKLPEQIVMGALASGTAACFTQPIDLIKVRMQLQGEAVKKAKGKVNAFSMVKNICKENGILGLYDGLSASLMRQISYSGTRIGVYPVIKHQVADKFGRFIKDPETSLIVKVVSGMGAGAIGAAAGNPADLIMVRMQADKRLPPESRRNYTSVFNGWMRVIREEGVLQLWRGCSPTVIRAMFVTAGQLSSYDQIKQSLLATQFFDDTVYTQFVASISAGFIATVVTNPIDVIKTRLMNSSSYSGVIDCFSRVASKEGLSAFYKGFMPSFVRLGPQTVITMLAYERIFRMAVYLKQSKQTSDRTNV